MSTISVTPKTKFISDVPTVAAASGIALSFVIWLLTLSFGVQENSADNKAIKETQTQEQRLNHDFQLRVIEQLTRVETKIDERDKSK
jgi:hypothetical protein